MADVFGPTFGDELAAVGLSGIVTWKSDGSLPNRASLTGPQETNLAAVIAAHNPLKARLNIIQFPTFIGRWTNAEYAGLMQARATAISGGSVGLVKQWDQASSSGWVDLNTPAAQNFKASIVSASILTQARADAIFT